MRGVLRSMFSQPAIADPPRRVWRDWVLLAAVYAAAVLETALRTDMVWRVPSLIVALAIGPTVLFRRTHPLVALTIAFGAVAAVDVAALIAGVEWDGHYAMAFLLTLPYAVFRWGSGRDGALSLLMLLAPTILGSLGQPNPVGNAFGGAVIVLLSALVGAVVRYEFDLMRRRVDDARTEQREEIARDLHDTVAHHVSAIAVQAQAGLAVAANDPMTAVET
ncbi:MAG: histidine kinase dimerization/phosphoacceptor domain-containing protein, partial [Actinomycetota bacterium]